MANLHFRALSGLAAGAAVIGSLLVAPVAQATVRHPLTPTTRSCTDCAKSRVAFTLEMEDQLLAYLRYLPVSFYVKLKIKSPVPTTTTTTVPTSTTTST